MAPPCLEADCNAERTKLPGVLRSLAVAKNHWPHTLSVPFQQAWSWRFNDGSRRTVQKIPRVKHGSVVVGIDSITWSSLRCAVQLWSCHACAHAIQLLNRGNGLPKQAFESYRSPNHQQENNTVLKLSRSPQCEREHVSFAPLFFWSCD
jgi:hypothetical protein